MERAEQVSGPLTVARSLVDVDRLEALDSYAPEMARATALMLEQGVDPLEVTQAVGVANDVLTARLLGLAEERLGPPPYAYAWLALGAHGRGEQVLSSDQDSALAYGGPRLGPGDPDDYFALLTGVVVGALARAGIPRCTGGYMATGWRFPLTTFVAQFERWVDEPRPAALLRAEIFLDFRPVHGDLDVGRLGEIIVAGGHRGSFLEQMAAAAVTFRPPGTVFGRLHTDHGRLDVKRAGTAAIVLLARLYALAAGTNPHSTRSRLEAAGAAGTLSARGVEELTDAYRLLTGLRLRHQIAQAGRGEPLDNRVDVDELDDADEERLRAALRTVRVMQRSTSHRFQTHAVT